MHFSKKNLKWLCIYPMSSLQPGLTALVTTVTGVRVEKVNNQQVSFRLGVQPIFHSPHQLPPYYVILSK